MSFRRITPLGAPAPVADEASRLVALTEPDSRGAVLERCHADPNYQRWVLACLQVRLSIQADQTFPHPADRRAQIARIMVADCERRTKAADPQ